MSDAEGRDLLIRQIADEIRPAIGICGPGCQDCQRTARNVLDALDRLGFEVIPASTLEADRRVGVREPDRFGMVFPDGAWFDCTESARLLGQDEEGRARLLARKAGGRAVRIVTSLVDVDGGVSDD